MEWFRYGTTLEVRRMPLNKPDQTTVVSGHVALDRRVRPLASRLSVLQVLLAERYPEHHAAVHEAICNMEYESQSRGMFIARLRMLQEEGVSTVRVADVLAMLDDCDMLAQRPNSDVSGKPPNQGAGQCLS